VNLREITLEIEQIAARHVLDQNIWQVRVARDEILDHVFVTLVRRVASFRGTESVRFPATWWDAVKERFAPDWMLRRWPVEYRTITARAMLPDVPLPVEQKVSMWRVLSVAP